MRAHLSILLLPLFVGACSGADDSPNAATGDDGPGAIATAGDDDASPRGDGGASPLGNDGGANGGTDGAPAGSNEGGVAPGALHVVMGTGGAPGHIVDGAGNVVQLHGVDRSGTEFECLSGNFADGPIDQASIGAMKSWNVNAVRVPLNEDCWLGINGVPAAYSGANYQKAVASFVDLLTSNGMIVFLDLHWTAPGTSQSSAQQPMADADHAPTFWSQVASAFKDDGTVVFDLFNEPFITDWTCWQQGGSCAQANNATYTAAGMATLLKSVRGAGAKNVVILGGLAYSSDMSQWVSMVNGMTSLAAPLDGISIDDVAASWHAYDFNSSQTGCPSQYNGYTGVCNSGATTAQNTSATSVLAAGFPVVLGEVGISAFDTTSAGHFSAAQITDIEGWLDDLLGWAESQNQGYLGWSWNQDTDPVLITAFDGTPTIDFGVTYQNHLKKF